MLLLLLHLLQLYDLFSVSLSVPEALHYIHHNDFLLSFRLLYMLLLLLHLLQQYDLPVLLFLFYFLRITVQVIFSIPSSVQLASSTIVPASQLCSVFAMISCAEYSVTYTAVTSCRFSGLFARSRYRFISHNRMNFLRNNFYLCFLTNGTGDFLYTVLGTGCFPDNFSGIPTMFLFRYRLLFLITVLHTLQ